MLRIPSPDVLYRACLPVLVALRREADRATSVRLRTMVADEIEALLQYVQQVEQFGFEV
jgi:hypothetical protein